MTVEARSLELRLKIEEKRRRLDSNIRGRQDLLKRQKLSRELDHLIGQYLDLS